MNNDQKTILFLDKVLLGPCRESPRGVEVFNLNLIRELVELGCSLTVLAHASWEKSIRDGSVKGNIDIVSPRIFSGGVMGALEAVFAVRSRKFSVLLLANVANRLTPALSLLRWFGVAPRCVLIAHREPSGRNIRAQKRWPTKVVAVNGKIASHFEKAGFTSVTVSYGITDAGLFEPASGSGEGNKVNFCVLGHLDSVWKGADTAVAGFRGLSADMGDSCCLHLAAFQNPPVFHEKNIVVYSWLPFSEIPDLLRGMDVLVVPSRDEEVMRETFSQAMVQGMLMGLPVIVSDLPVLTEKLDGDNSLVFGNTNELTEIMARLVSDPDERKKKGDRLRGIALERYIWNTKKFVKEVLIEDN